MSNELPEMPVHHVEGPQKPDMPINAAKSSPLPLKMLASQIVSMMKANAKDLKFIKYIATNPKTPEFGDYNTRTIRLKGKSPKPKTKAVYLPLVDMSPAEPTTMLTAMVEAQKITNVSGQQYTIFTNDQQLYKVVVNVTWVFQDCFVNFIPRLGVCTH